MNQDGITEDGVFQLFEHKSASAEASSAIYTQDRVFRLEEYAAAGTSQQMSMVTFIIFFVIHFEHRSLE